MTTLRLVIPFGVDFAVAAGSAERMPAEYREFWQRARTELDALPEEVRSVAETRLEHAEAGRRGSRYSSIKTDSVTHSSHILEVEISPSVVPADMRPESFESVDFIRVRIYPHQVGLADISISLKRIPPSPDVWLDDLQAQSVAFGERMTELIHREFVMPLTAAVRAADKGNAFLLAPYQGLLEMGAALWVSRSLLVEASRRSVLAHWTKDVVGSGNESLRDDLLNGTRHSLVRWLNYAFVDINDEGADALENGVHGAELNALRYAQVIYASLERVDTQLKLVLADAAAANTRWKLEQLQEDLSQLSTRAELIVMERQELQKFMARPVRAFFEMILSSWEYDALVEQPALFKIELCNRRLAELASKRTARSTVVTDLILLGIGVTSIAGTAIAITDFGRSAAADPLSTGYDLGRNDFTSWFAAQPIDLVLLASGAVSVILVALYLYFRRDERS